MWPWSSLYHSAPGSPSLTIENATYLLSVPLYGLGTMWTVEVIEDWKEISRVICAWHNMAPLLASVPPWTKVTREPWNNSPPHLQYLFHLIRPFIPMLCGHVEKPRLPSQPSSCRLFPYGRVLSPISLSSPTPNFQNTFVVSSETYSQSLTKSPLFWNIVSKYSFQLSVLSTDPPTPGYFPICPRWFCPRSQSLPFILYCQNARWF